MTLGMQVNGQAPWDAIADGYDDFVTPTHLDLGDQALELAGLEPGQAFLDVAAGSGGLSIPAARRGARVLATDISPRMLARLAARARREGLAELETRVSDGQALEVESGTFDLAGSQFGVMLFPDLPKGLSEMRRATRPGGRVLLVAFGSPREVEFLGFFQRAVRAADPSFEGLPTDPPPLPFQVSDPDVLRRRFVEAGLKDVRVERTTEPLAFASAASMWAWVENSNPLGAMLASRLDPARRETALEALDELLRERAAGGPVAELTSPINIGIGTV